MQTIEDFAISYLERGWSPIPAKPGEKLPRFSWKSYQEQRATPQEVHRWFTTVPGGNLSIVTGEISDLTVIDVDGDAGLQSLSAYNIMLPSTYTVKSPHGHHFYYHYQASPTTIAGIIDHVDVRSNGGCICAPPSWIRSTDTHTGGVYTVLDDRPLAQLGDVFNGIHQRSRQTQHAPSDNWIVELLRNGAPDGTRNDQAARLAGYLKTKHPIDIVQALMENWNLQNKPPLADDELQSVVSSVERYHHPRSTFEMGSWDYFPPTT